ncbi:hypothetical protein [Pseudomonas maumuensis]|uniref:Uncharacterized protein n=1 Tax=Pseudomonas maumuensis TaxID=2842354 RepID=A0ABX8NKR6_9PSED|nr:hypothetical protein [Pseudomonas maumuensis]QXH56597.1 hypothetical protein KSS90_25345 [Pseudomonas maumuensis]
MDNEAGKRTQLFVGVRKTNGQIGYLSESLSIPEFFELVRPRDHHAPVLVDFSPVIEALHSLHNNAGDEEVITKYKAMYSYWHDSISYSNIQIRAPKCESLSKAANELLITLESRILNYSNAYRHRRTGDSSKNLTIILALEKEVNIAVDTLLCFIHSKASLEISSFKKDMVLGEYCSRLLKVLGSLFNEVLEYKTYNNQFQLGRDSLLFYLAMTNIRVVDSYSQLLPHYENNQDLRLGVLHRGERNNAWDGYDNYEEIMTRYRVPNDNELKMAEVLRDLCYKVRSVNSLINTLKDEFVEWESSENSIEELKSLISFAPPTVNS